MNKDEWQTYLDRLFPSGVNVTAVSPSGMPEDDYQFLSPQLTVMDVVEGVPHVSAFIAGVDQDSQFTIADMQETQTHVWQVTQVNPKTRKYVLSRNFSASTAEALKAMRV
jgi:hypothetical protein